MGQPNLSCMTRFSGAQRGPRKADHKKECCILTYRIWLRRLSVIIHDKRVTQIQVKSQRSCFTVVPQLYHALEKEVIRSILHYILFSRLVMVITFGILGINYVRFLILLAVS